MAESSRTKKQDPILAQLFTPLLRKGDLRKGEIIQAAVDILASEGPEALSFESIGSRLGIRRSHVAYHFQDNREVMLRAVQYSIANLQLISVEKVSAAKKDKDKFRAYLEAAFEWVELHPKQAVTMVLLYHFSLYRKEWNELHHLYRKTAVDRIAALLKNAALVQTAGIDECAERVIEMLTGALIGLSAIPQNEFKRVLAQKKTETIRAIISFLESQ